MRVVRLKKSYRIELSDAEFGVLSAIVEEAEAGQIEEGIIQYLEPAEQHAWHLRCAGGFIRLDEDRR